MELINHEEEPVITNIYINAIAKLIMIACNCKENDIFASYNVIIVSVLQYV